MSETNKLPKELRKLLAKREVAKADVLLSEAETARKKAEVLTLQAELLKSDTTGLLKLAIDVPAMSW